MGMREDMYAQSGQHSFSLASEREETPSASNHRYQIGKLSVEETQSMLHETTEELIKRARRDSELVGKLSAAIDITKGIRGLVKLNEMQTIISRKIGFLGILIVVIITSGQPSKSSVLIFRSYLDAIPVKRVNETGRDC